MKKTFVLSFLCLVMVALVVNASFSALDACTSSMCDRSVSKNCDLGCAARSSTCDSISQTSGYCDFGLCISTYRLTCADSYYWDENCSGPSGQCPV